MNFPGSTHHALEAHDDASRAIEAAAAGVFPLAKRLHLRAAKGFLAASELECGQEDNDGDHDCPSSFGGGGSGGGSEGVGGGDGGSGEHAFAAAGADTGAARTTVEERRGSGCAGAGRPWGGGDGGPGSGAPGSGVDLTLKHALLLLARAHARAAASFDARCSGQGVSGGGGEANGGEEEAGKTGTTTTHGDRDAADRHTTSSRTSSSDGGVASGAASGGGGLTYMHLQPPHAAPAASPTAVAAAALDDSVLGGRQAPFSSASSSSSSSSLTSATEEFLALEIALLKLGKQPLHNPLPRHHPTPTPPQPSALTDGCHRRNQDGGSGGGGGGSGSGNKGSGKLREKERKAALMEGSGALLASLSASLSASMSHHHQPVLLPRGIDDGGDEAQPTASSPSPARERMGGGGLGSDSALVATSLLGESFVASAAPAAPPAPAAAAAASSKGSATTTPLHSKRKETKVPSPREKQTRGSAASGTEVKAPFVAGVGGGGGGGVNGAAAAGGASVVSTIREEEVLRCLKLTQLLHDENATLLEEREHCQAMAAEAAEVAAAVEKFKTEYSSLFEKVRTEMLRFRAAYPQQSHSLAAAVPTQAEVQLKQLAQAYERKSRKLSESEALRKKQLRKLEETEALARKYEAAFRKITNRVTKREL